MSKTLYISDLDGTLLNSSQRISEKSSRIINNLVEKGMTFSYATARSVYTARKAAAGLTAKIPLIVYNGAFIVDNITMERIAVNVFTDDEAKHIYNTLTNGGVYPIVYSLIDNIEKFSYDTLTLSRGLSDFIVTRKGDFRDRPLAGNRDILLGNKFYFTCIDSAEKLAPIYNSLKSEFNCCFQTDIYSSEHWLEIMPAAATKANAILQLKNILGCDRVVSFGDAVNDITMAKISDEFYAVGNAVDELKSLASAVIGCNDDDGVAEWLLENYI